MRLLDTKTLELKTFVDKIPPYAILSHCWEEEEVVFADLVDLDKARAKKGFSKIEKTCEQALKDEFDYVWIDTCCIDKSSSAELSEAINSMFAWYKDSNKCYAYLADVGGPEGFAGSKWFMRAWTLQELLAPSSWQTDEKPGMEFFSHDWLRLGSKAALGDAISSITGIPKEYLEGKSLLTASISMRMSWAANRQATRAEDIAYSLIGIFDVNIPLLYGEGKLKAFRRLQEEIMRISEDETLFAWDSMEFATDNATSDVLASDPKDFEDASHLVPFASDDRLVPYAMTHRGLRIWLQLFTMDHPDNQGWLRTVIRPLRSPIMIWSSHDLIWAVLRCHVAHDFHHFVIIPLRHLAADIYLRDTSTNVGLISSEHLPHSTFTEEIYIRNSRIPSISASIQRRFGFLIRGIPEGWSIARAHPKEAWDPKDLILQGNKAISGYSSWHASLLLTTTADLSTSSEDSTSGMIFIGLGCRKGYGENDPKAWCHLDDTIWNNEEGSLSDFYNNLSIKQERYSCSAFRHGDVTRRDVKFNVLILQKKVFGQDMFVVDIELNRVGSDLRVPDLSPPPVGPSKNLSPIHGTGLAHKEQRLHQREE